MNNVFIVFQGFSFFIFVSNLLLGIWDVAKDPNPARFKATALVFTALENVIFWCMYGVLYCLRRNDSDQVPSSKKQQYMENAIHEVRAQRGVWVR